MNNPTQNQESQFSEASKNRLVTYGDLLGLKSELLFAVKQALKESSTTSKQWLKSHEVRKLLGISSGTLQTLRNNGTIPYSRIGGVVFYNAEDINKMMNEHRSLTR